MPVNKVSNDFAIDHSASSTDEVYPQPKHEEEALESYRYQANVDPAECLSQSELDLEKQEEKEAPEALDVPPNGGLTAWLQVVAAFFAFFNSWGIVNTFGVYQDYYRKHLLVDCTPSEISWIDSIIASLICFGTVIFGPLMDLGYIKYLAFAGGITQTLGMMMLSLCTEYYQVVLAQGIVLGIGAAILFLVGVGTVAPYFSTKRSFAIGLGASGSSLGGTLYPIAVTRLIDEVGFGWSARIVGFIVMCTSLVTALCVKRRLPPRKVTSLFDFSTFKDKPMVAYSAANTFTFFGFFMMTFYAQAYTVTIAPNAAITAYITSLFNAGSIFGRILPNFLSDRIGAFNVLIPCLVACVILGFAWQAVDSAASAAVWAVLTGFFSGPIVSLPGTICAKLTPDLRKLGVRLAFIQTFSGVACLLSGPMAGIILNQYGYKWLKLTSAISMLIGTGFCVLARLFLTRKVVVKV